MKSLEYATSGEWIKRIIRQFLSKSFLIIPLFLVISCGWITRKPVELDLEQIKTCPAKYDGRLVSTEGCLGSYPERIKVFCSYNFCKLNISSEPDKKSNVRAAVYFGKGPNQMEELSEEFGWYGGAFPVDGKDEKALKGFHKALRMQTDDNKVVGALDKLKITGRLIITVPSENCHIEVEKIEQLQKVAKRLWKELRLHSSYSSLKNFQISKPASQLEPAFVL